jgi:hypothetical protein
MAAISLTLTTGKDGFRISDFTTGANAPSAGDFEFRFNTTDANSNPVTIKEVVIALEAFERAVLSDAQIITPPTI